MNIADSYATQANPQLYYNDIHSPGQLTGLMPMQTHTPNYIPNNNFNTSESWSPTSYGLAATVSNVVANVYPNTSTPTSFITSQPNSLLQCDLQTQQQHPLIQINNDVQQLYPSTSTAQSISSWTSADHLYNLSANQHNQNQNSQPPQTTTTPANTAPTKIRRTRGANSNNQNNNQPTHTYKWMEVKRSVVKPAAPKKKVVQQYNDNSGTNRTNFTYTQLTELEKEYHTCKYLPRNRRSEIAQLLDLNETQVKIWFQNRRMKEKKRQKEAEFLNKSTVGQFSPTPTDSLKQIQNQQKWSNGSNSSLSDGSHSTTSSSCSLTTPETSPKLHEIHYRE